MTRRVILTGGVMVVVAGGFLVALARPDAAHTQGPQAGMTGYVAPVAVDTAGLPGPVQPIFYRHDVHAGQYQMDCRYCHFAVEESANPGLPTLSTCMGCHLIAGAQNPEVQKLTGAYRSGEGVEWVEVHTLAPFVHFPHMRHVNSELGEFAGKTVAEKCEVCHGPIRDMPQVYQFASLKMGWCITCHEQNNVNQDCTACHY